VPIDAFVRLRLAEAGFLIGLTTWHSLQFKRAHVKILSENILIAELI